MSLAVLEDVVTLSVEKSYKIEKEKVIADKALDKNSCLLDKNSCLIGCLINGVDLGDYRKVERFGCLKYKKFTEEAKRWKLLME